jgi:hypothetical protein
MDGAAPQLELIAAAWSRWHDFHYKWRTTAFDRLAPRPLLLLSPRAALTRPLGMRNATTLSGAREALDAAVRVRQTTRTTLARDNRPLKIQIPARDSPTSGNAVVAAHVGASSRPSLLKTPGFMSARAESSFAAAASLGSDQPPLVGPYNGLSRTATRRRLVEPVDSANPRVGRGMAKIYSGALHAIRCELLLVCSCLMQSDKQSVHSNKLETMSMMIPQSRGKGTSRARRWASACQLRLRQSSTLSSRSGTASRTQFRRFRCEKLAIAGESQCMCRRTSSTARRKIRATRLRWRWRREQPQTRHPPW